MRGGGVVVVVATQVAAVGATKCAKISRKKFFRVMGPCQDVLKHNMLRLYPQYAGQL